LENDTRPKQTYTLNCRDGHEFKIGKRGGSRQRRIKSLVGQKSYRKRCRFLLQSLVDVLLVSFEWTKRDARLGSHRGEKFKKGIKYSS
jgi:hypothetical protein